MVKTSKNNDSAKKSYLIMTREDLVKILLEQIEHGKMIAALPVMSKMVQEYYGRNFRYVYDKEQEKFFNKERKTWVEYVQEVLKHAFTEPDNEYLKEFTDAGVSLIIVSGTDYIQEERDEINDKITCLESLIKRLPLIPSAIDNGQENKNTTDVSSKKVFIVHGHDSLARTEVELLVNKLGYEPIVLFKQASGGKTIIEKLEDETQRAAFAIVLYTACDMGRAKDTETESPRARQNVVFEHGYLCAKLGRNKVCALVEQGVEQPSDLAGVIYISLNDSWNYIVAKEMQKAGLQVDLNKI